MVWADHGGEGLQQVMLDGEQLGVYAPTMMPNRRMTRDCLTIVVCVSVAYWCVHLFFQTTLSCTPQRSRIFDSEAGNIDVSSYQDSGAITQHKHSMSLSTSRPLQECFKEVKHVMFLKMHKAGSSTMQNIFLRFALARDLNVVLLNSFKGSFHIIGRNVVKDRIIPIPKNQSYNILCNHIVYNRNELTKIMPGYAMNITIVREPTTHFLSSSLYFGFFNNLKRIAKPNNDWEKTEEFLILDYIKNPGKYKNVGTMLVHNLQSLDLGLNAPDFFNRKKIDDIIKIVDEDFQLVMVMEYFDESLILMIRYLCWDLKDVIYVPNNAGKSQVNITENPYIVSWLHQWNRADYMLYAHFQKKFWRHVHAEGVEFFLEVQYFKIIVQNVWNFCLNVNRKEIQIEESRWNKAFRLNKYDCQYILLDERSFVKIMMDKAARKVNITLPNV
ncbi:hypothetical protein ScPMuIL_010402 [Solemya velum]